MEKTYDFVVIGSGMGGLVSACILAKEGFSVLVLEKNHQLGGNLQVFSRDKRIFDTGVHYIGSLDPGENLYQFFSYLEIIDQLKLKRLENECFDLVCFPDGSKYPYGQGYENFMHILSGFFPEEKHAIETFCNKIKEVCTYFPLYNLENEGEKTYYNTAEILEVNAHEYICSLTTNKRLQNILAGTNLLYAGVKDKTPLYVLALILNSNLCGSYRLIDGSSQIAIQLAKVIRKYGGTILKHEEVISAQYNENGEVIAVLSKQGHTFRGKNFISNLHPSITIDIFGKDRFINAYTKRIKSLENTQSCFVVQLSLKEKSLPYFNYNMYSYFTDDVWEAVHYNGDQWPISMYISSSVSSKSPDYVDVLSIMAYMSPEEVDQWNHTIHTVFEKSTRDEAYLDFKKEKEKQVLDKLETIFPDIREKITSVYSSSPLTYRDYIGTVHGSTYGILKNSQNPAATIINPKTKIPNLYLTGQNLIFHGILGTTVGGFVTCFNFVDKNKIINHIKEAYHAKM